MTEVVPAAKPVEPSPPIEVYHSDRIADVSSMDVAPRRARSVRRARLREIVPSAPWYTQATTDKGVSFPVPGMKLSIAVTWFPAEHHQPTSKASRRYMSPYQGEDRFDLLTLYDANELRLPPAWSMRLVAGMLQRRDVRSIDPLRKEITLRSVKLGLMTKWEWTKHTARGPVVVASVRCSYPILRDVSKAGEPPKLRSTGGRRRTRDKLRYLWPIDEVPIVVYPKPKEPVHVTDSEVS